MAVDFPPIYGVLSENCPPYAKRECYVPCEHEDEVVNEGFAPVFGPDEFLTTIIKAQLDGQANFIQTMCEWTPDICTQGAWLGFPCVQCGIITFQGWSMCSIKTQVFDESNCPGLVGVKTIVHDDPCTSFCGDLCESCVIGEFDFRSSEEAEALYLSIVNTLRDNPAPDASLTSINEFLVNVWGAGAEVAVQKGNVYSVYLGRDPTELEYSISPILERALPLPACSKLELVTVTLN